MRPPTQMFAIVCLNYTFFRLNFKMEPLFGATVVSDAWGLLDIWVVDGVDREFRPGVKK